MSEPDELRQALDDAMLTHTGRSIGDVASQRVLDDIMLLMAAAQQAELDHVRAEYEQEMVAQASWMAKALRVEIELLRAENAAMREIVETVASSLVVNTRPFSDGYPYILANGDIDLKAIHEAARAVLAKEGEA